MKHRFPKWILPFLAVVFCLSAIAIPLALSGSGKEVAANALPEKEWVIVIDAGHGGEDGGATNADGTILEKDLNLDIAEKLCTLLSMNGIPCKLTRSTDELLYDKSADYQGRKKQLDLAARREIAEETENALFVSIHMNSYPAPQYSGLQVWYSPNNEASKAVAEAIQRDAKALLQPENRRQVKAAGSNIYLLDRLECPAVLVECGFLSNPEEAEKLSTEEYREQVAFTLFLSISNLWKYGTTG